jgi:hypothetical protein
MAAPGEACRGVAGVSGVVAPAEAAWMVGATPLTAWLVEAAELARSGWLIRAAPLTACGRWRRVCISGDGVPVGEEDARGAAPCVRAFLAIYCGVGCAFAA